MVWVECVCAIYNQIYFPNKHAQACPDYCQCEMEKAAIENDNGWKTKRITKSRSMEFNSIPILPIQYRVHARAMRVSVLCAIDKSTKYIHLFV